MATQSSPAPPLLASAVRVVALVALGFGFAHILPLVPGRVAVEPGDAAQPGAAVAPGAQDSAAPASQSGLGVSGTDSGPVAAEAPASPPGGSLSLGMALDIPAVAESVMPSVVSITTSSRSYYGQEMGGGSGVIVRSDGIVLTNNHVVEGATEASAQLSDGRIFRCRLVGRDPGSDLAVLRLVGVPEGELVPVRFGDSENLRLGESVLAIGNPFGLSGTVTMGIVSALGRGDVGIVDYEEFIQTDAAINPGNSGGALVNVRGELVGINTAILSRSGGSQGIGFAIPTHLIRPIMESLIETGRVDRGWLGIYIADMTPQRAQQLQVPDATVGVLVIGLVRGGPAETSGLRQGDIIQSVAGEPVGTPSRLKLAVARHRAGESVQVRVLRVGGEDSSAQTEDVSVMLAPLPQERSAFYPWRRR